MRTDIVAAHGQLNSFGMNFAQKLLSHHSSICVAIPYLLLVAGAVGLQYLQMSRLNARNPQASQANPQAAMLQKYMPLIFGFIYLNVAAILNVYFIVLERHPYPDTRDPVPEGHGGRTPGRCHRVVRRQEGSGGSVGQDRTGVARSRSRTGTGQGQRGRAERTAPTARDARPAKATPARSPAKDGSSADQGDGIGQRIERPESREHRQRERRRVEAQNTKASQREQRF